MQLFFLMIDPKIFASLWFFQSPEKLLCLFFSVFIVLMEEKIFGDPYCDILEVPLWSLFLYFFKIVVSLFQLF